MTMRIVVDGIESTRLGDVRDDDGAFIEGSVAVGRRMIELLHDGSTACWCSAERHDDLPDGVFPGGAVEHHLEGYPQMFRDDNEAYADRWTKGDW